MARLISRQRGGLAALKLTKLFGIDVFPAAKDSGKVLIIVIYCYLIIIDNEYALSQWLECCGLIRRSRLCPQQILTTAMTRIVVDKSTDHARLHFDLFSPQY